MHVMTKTQPRITSAGNNVIRERRTQTRDERVVLIAQSTTTAKNYPQTTILPARFHQLVSKWFGTEGTMMHGVVLQPNSMQNLLIFVKLAEMSLQRSDRSVADCLAGVRGGMPMAAPGSKRMCGG